jgi:uncharacterized membrane protein YhhN
MTASIFVAAAVVLFLLLIAEKRESRRGKLIFKPLLSALFVWTALLQPKPDAAFAAWVLAGLGLSWVGDVLLIFKSRGLFLCGLVAFLLAHGCYASGFYQLGSMRLWVWAALAVVLITGAVILRWFWPYLDGMCGPVAAYVTVISAMVGGALAVGAAPAVAVPGRWVVPAGASLFYFSDICVARDQFVASKFSNRLLGLPPYYLAQFFFAVSIGLV